MNLNDYFEPVSLDRPANNHLSDKAVFCKNIYINTPDTPVKDLDSYQIAIIGLPEDRSARKPGAARAPDQIRKHLYQLIKLNQKLRIIDMGNLKSGNSIMDSYYAIRDISLELISRNIILICLGGSQDLTYGTYLAFEQLNRKFNFVTVDSRLDMGIIEDEVSPESFLIPILSRKKELLFNYTNIGHQAYYVDQQDLDFLRDNFHLSMRLGEVRNDMAVVEPFLRDAGFVSMDMCAVRQADAPGCSHPSPNGFTGEEICQLSRYAGLSQGIRSFGLYNIIPESDLQGQTAHLAAQIIWYFMEGISQRKIEDPASNPSLFKKFIVNLHNTEHDIIFYKSLDTARWWFEVPVLQSAKKSHILLSSSLDDYQKACNHEIPERWLNAFQKLN